VLGHALTYGLPWLLHSAQDCVGRTVADETPQVDFLRNIVTARETRNGRPRDIPMNHDVSEARGKHKDGKVILVGVTKKFIKCPCG